MGNEALSARTRVHPFDPSLPYSRREERRIMNAQLHSTLQRFANDRDFFWRGCPISSTLLKEERTKREILNTTTTPSPSAATTVESPPPEYAAQEEERYSRLKQRFALLFGQIPDSPDIYSPNPTTPIQRRTCLIIRPPPLSARTFLPNDPQCPGEWGAGGAASYTTEPNARSAITVGSNNRCTTVTRQQHNTQSNTAITTVTTTATAAIITTTITMATAPKFTVPELPYPKDALEPGIPKEIVEVHYEKHHKGYATKLNQLTAGKPEEHKSLVELIQSASGPIYNNAAQVYNHTFYWDGMKPKSKPSEAVIAAISKSFGSMEEFKKKILDRAAAHFGSGWIWLVETKEGKLDLWDGHDAGNPLTVGLKPILNVDVWEHAYYLKYKNVRADYLAAWFDLINWDFVAKNL